MLILTLPARCDHCDKPIAEWSGAGMVQSRWLHKSCWRELQRSQARSGDAIALRAPTERSGELELPMMISLLMFHFGLAAAVAGWLLLARDYAFSGSITLAIGLVTPLVGAGGIVLNVISRRRFELIRQEIEAAGGWKPAA